MLSRFAAIGVATVLLISRALLAQPLDCSGIPGQIHVSVLPAESGSCQISANGDGSFAVILTRTALVGDVMFAIIGETDAALRVASVTLEDPEYNAARDQPERQRRSHLRIHGPNQNTDRVASVGSVNRVSGDWTIDRIAVSGNVGESITPIHVQPAEIDVAINVDEVEVMRVDGRGYP
jgi:hypothetical protein